MKTWRAVAVGGLVVAALMQAEHEAPGATGRGAAGLRSAVSPAVAEGVGAASDALTIARETAAAQGLNPGALLSPPVTAAGSAVSSGPPDQAQLPQPDVAAALGNRAGG